MTAPASEESHYVVAISITKVTNYFETKAYGSGSRPSGYETKELDKHRRSATVANFVASQRDLTSALELAGAQIQLIAKHNEAWGEGQIPRGEVEKGKPGGTLRNVVVHPVE